MMLMALNFSHLTSLHQIPSSSRYNDKYVLSFLNGFKGYLRKYKSPKYVIPIVVPKPSYPGYELLATLKSIGLPALSYPKKSLGGIVAYLKVAKISKAKFVLRIKRYRSAILRLVLKYRVSIGWRKCTLKPNNVWATLCKSNESGM